MPTNNRYTDPIMLFFIQERLRQRKTQKVLARLSGIEYRMLQRLEQGERPIDIRQIRLLCAALKIPFSHVALHEAVTESRRELIHSLPVSIRNELLDLIHSIHQELEKKRA
ncbi:helix-turn-helix domain-containing protein [Vibrio cyclitrophicus]